MLSPLLVMSPEGAGSPLCTQARPKYRGKWAEKTYITMIFRGIETITIIFLLYMRKSWAVAFAKFSVVNISALPPPPLNTAICEILGSRKFLRVRYSIVSSSMPMGYLHPLSPVFHGRNGQSGNSVLQTTGLNAKREEGCSLQQGNGMAPMPNELRPATLLHHVHQGSQIISTPPCNRIH